MHPSMHNMDRKGRHKTYNKTKREKTKYQRANKRRIQEGKKTDCKNEEGKKTDYQTSKESTSSHYPESKQRCITNNELSSVFNLSEISANYENILCKMLARLHR